MDARAKTVRDILHSGDRYLVPFFQRHYSWEKKHWQRLLDDVLDLMDDDTSQHFLGPLVCTPFRPAPGEVTPYQLIDGQQRLTTLCLAFAALRDVARRHHEAELADEIAEDYLTNKRRQGAQRFKVVPRTGTEKYFSISWMGGSQRLLRAEELLSASASSRRNGPSWRRSIRPPPCAGSLSHSLADGAASALACCQRCLPRTD